MVKKQSNQKGASVDKNFEYRGKTFSIEHPNNIEFQDEFSKEIYTFMFGRIVPNVYEPCIDVDLIANGANPLGVHVLNCSNNRNFKIPSNKASNYDRLAIQYKILNFLEEYPVFAGFIKNCVFSSNLAISNAEFLLGERCDSANFMVIKSIIDEIASKVWSRDRDKSEGQSGVSTLGTISENLLEMALEDLVDDKNLFKVNNSQVQSYGDFVLMCLPNNLWISVKSNFARERLLASGYNNDIIGVGFFESFEEFTGQVRVRNFQRAGFLAMYCPDTPVSSQQLQNNKSTYSEIVEFHEQNASEIPKNINGRPFIRPLSSLKEDLLPLLAENDVRKRFTVSF